MPNYMFHLQFPTPEAPKDVIFDCFFESIDGISCQVWSDATFTLLWQYLLFATASINGSRCLAMKDQYYPRLPLTYGKDRELSTCASFFNPGTGNERFRLLTGNPDIPLGFGFTLEQSELKGWSANGSLIRTVVLETLPATNYNLSRRLNAIFKSGQKIDFYVNEVLKGTITDRLPPPTSNANCFMWAELRNMDATPREMKISEFRVSQSI